jgi:hypothetical protein
MKGVHENLEDCTLVISDRCPPGTYCECFRHLAQEYLCQIWAVQGIGQDIINLVAVVVMCIAASFCDTRH